MLDTSDSTNLGKNGLACYKLLVIQVQPLTLSLEDLGLHLSLEIST